MMPPINLTPIGKVKSALRDVQAADLQWRNVVSEIHLEDSFAPGLQGLENWSHVVVIFVMHEADFDPQAHLVFQPGARDDMPATGVFAQRSRFYPNSIGLTTVQVLGIENNVLHVQGLDAIDGTPVLALKPYAPVFDGAHDSTVPVWFVRLMQGAG